jgi:hypothetical protein
MRCAPSAENSIKIQLTLTRPLLSKNPLFHTDDKYFKTYKSRSCEAENIFKQLEREQGSPGTLGNAVLCGSFHRTAG